jgi:hypothetical protein
MAVQAKPTTLDLDAHRLLAVWAVKTVYLRSLPATSTTTARGR